MIYPDGLRALETGKCFAVSIGDAAVMDCDRSAFINIAGVKSAFRALSYVSFRRASIYARSWRNRRNPLASSRNFGLCYVGYARYAYFRGLTK
jgi:hypothetical protein